MLGSPLQQLTELPLKRRQIQPELGPASTVDLLQQPGAVLLQLLNQRGRILCGLSFMGWGAVHRLRKGSIHPEPHMARMAPLSRPHDRSALAGSLVTIAGGVLTVVGAVAYGTGNANLSLPTIFYGIPIFWVDSP